MQKRPRVTDAEFTVVENPQNLPAQHKREPVISSWWNLFWFVALLGGAIFWKGYLNSIGAG